MTEEHLSPERIIAFVDGDIESHEEDAVLQHLRTCSQCWKETENLMYLDHHAFSFEHEDVLPMEIEISPAAHQKLGKNIRLLLERGNSNHGPVIESRSDRGAWFGFRRTLLAMAACLLILLSPYFFDHTRVLIPHLSKPQPVAKEATRGASDPDEKPIGYFFDVIPGNNNYFYILNLDGNKKLCLLYPYSHSDESPLNYFNLKGPFRMDRSVRIPPYDYYNYPTDKDEDPGFIFVIPSPKALDKETLLGFQHILGDPEIVDNASLDDLGQIVFDWLNTRYPSTEMIDL